MPRFRARTIDDITQVAREHGVPVIEVDPRGTTHSEEHSEVTRRYGVDKHTASAILVARRGLRKIKQVLK